MEVPAAETIRPRAIDDLRGADAAAVQRPCAATHGRSGVAIEPARVQCHVGGRSRFARRLRDDVHGAGQRIRAPHRRGGTAHDLDLLDVVGIGRHEVPQNESEEVEIDRAAVEQRQLRRGGRARRLPAGDVDIARRHLYDVHARNGTKQVAHVLRRQRLDRGGRQHGHRRRCIDQRGADPRRRHDHGFFETADLHRDRRHDDGFVADDDIVETGRRKADQQDRDRVRARRDVVETILSFRAGDRDQPRPSAHQCDRRLGECRARFVNNRAGHRGLRECWGRHRQ